MALPVWQATIVRENGDVVPGAEVSVFLEETGVEVPIYSDRLGNTELSPPHFANSDGFFQFYAPAADYRITAEDSGTGFTRTWRYVSLFSPDADIVTPKGPKALIPALNDRPVNVEDVSELAEVSPAEKQRFLLPPTGSEYCYIYEWDPNSTIPADGTEVLEKPGVAMGRFLAKTTHRGFFNAGAPNIIGGFSENSIATGLNVRANVIAGGGYTDNINKMDGPETRYATIGGGYDNYIDGESSTTDLDGAASTIAGGAHHIIKCTHATITGGSYGVLGVGCDYSFIGGGTANEILDLSEYCTISGGETNRITGTNADNSTIGGGRQNTINGANSTIGGGSANTCGTGIANTIAGGVNNTAQGGNATVLGGTSNLADGQGAISWGRSAQATARGALCFTTDDSQGDHGYNNSLANSAAWRFRAGQRFMGEQIVTTGYDNDGGIEEIISETVTAVTTTASSINISAAIPTNSVIIGCQVRINESLAQNIDIAYTGGATQSIATNLPFSQNSKINKWFDPFSATPLTSGGDTFVTMTPAGGGSFTAQGDIYVQVRYKKFRNTDNV